MIFQFSKADAALAVGLVLQLELFPRSLPRRLEKVVHANRVANQFRKCEIAKGPRTAIEHEVERLEKYRHHITGCRVGVVAPHRHDAVYRINIWGDGSAPRRRAWFEHKLCHDCPAILNRLLGRPLSASLGTIMKRPEQVRYDPFRALFG